MLFIITTTITTVNFILCGVLIWRIINSGRLIKNLNEQTKEMIEQNSRFKEQQETQKRWFEAQQETQRQWFEIQRQWLKEQESKEPNCIRSWQELET